MTSDDIIRMAQEARLAFDCDDYPDIWQTYMNVGREEIERFAALVAAAEREAILSMLKGIDRCEADDRNGWWEMSVDAKWGARLLATIRARGEQK